MNGMDPHREEFFYSALEIRDRLRREGRERAFLLHATDEQLQFLLAFLPEHIIEFLNRAIDDNQIRLGKRISILVEGLECHGVHIIFLMVLDGHMAKIACGNLIGLLQGLSIGFIRKDNLVDQFDSFLRLEWRRRMIAFVP